MSRYILNSAVLTAAGLYRYEILNVSQARAWLGRPGWESHVRYGETAEVLKLMCGVVIPVKRTPVHMTPGDEALIVRLTIVINNLFDKRNLTDRDWVRDHTELGLLRRIE